MLNGSGVLVGSGGAAKNADSIRLLSQGSWLLTKRVRRRRTNGETASAARERVGGSMTGWRSRGCGPLGLVWVDAGLVPRALPQWHFLGRKWFVAKMI